MSNSLPAAKAKSFRMPWRLAANATTVCILAIGLLALSTARSVGITLLLMAVATALDGLDGWLARRAGGPRLSGAILDLAADMAAFGLAPAAMAAHLWPGAGWPLQAALGAYLAASLARLTRSCLHYASRPPQGYMGLPMPACGWLLASLALTLNGGLPLAAAIVGIAALAVSRRTYPSPAWILFDARVPALACVLAAMAAAGAWRQAGVLVMAVCYAAYPLARPVSAAGPPAG